MGYNKRCIAFDFDGVLAVYDGYRGPTVLGDPMPGVLELVTELIARGLEVIVFTVRDAGAVLDWLAEHGFPLLEVTNMKLGKVSVFLDDRAVCFDPIQMQVLAIDKYADYLCGFQPHWKRG